MSVSATRTGRREVVEALREAIHNLLVIKGRLPVLQALAHELERAHGGQEYRVRNDAVLWLVRDSYDMLVVDRYELRRFGPDDVDLGTVRYIGEPLSKAAEADFVAGCANPSWFQYRDRPDQITLALAKGLICFRTRAKPRHAHVTPGTSSHRKCKRACRILRCRADS